MKSKKGQLGGLTAIVAGLIVVGILLGAGYFIMQEFLEQDEFADSYVLVINESGITSIIDSTSSTVANQNASGFNSFTVLAIVNASDPADLVATTNYTVDANTGVITGTLDSHNYSAVNVTYSYLYGESSYDSIEDTITAIDTVPDLLPLLILILVVGIILTILFVVIPGARVSGA